MKRTFGGLLAIVAILALCQVAKADSLTFNFQDGGSSLPGSGPYASGTLTLLTPGSGGCASNGDGDCIQVTLTAASGYLLYTQTNGYAFVFNDSTDTAVLFSNCSAYLSCSGSSVSPATNTLGFDGFGYYEFGVGAGANGNTTGASPATASTFTFDVQDPTDNFTSVSQLEVLDTTSGSGDTYAGKYDFGAHVCEENGSTGNCTQQPGTAFPVHAYVGGVVPEPGTLGLLLGGLLALGLAGLVRRRKDAMAGA